MTTRRWVPWLMAAVLLGPALESARAQSAGEMTERLKALYAAHIIADVCQMTLSDERRDSLNEEIATLEDRLKLGDAEADRIYTAINQEAEAVETARLCARESAWVQRFDEAMAGLPR